MRSWVLALACSLLIALPVTGLQLGATAPAPALPMQADPASPIWDALRAQGRGPAEWAVLLTSDADGNGRTDFLDLSILAAAATGQSRTPVELLARGTPAALERLAAGHPATPIPAADALFLTVPLGEVAGLSGNGVEQLVWEPRAYTTWSTNPAGGAPANLPQNVISQGGTAWATYTGTGVRLAVLDTGADIGHDALDGGKVTAFKDCIGTGATSYDDHGHGTHVASIAAGDDGTDFKGIAPGASLVIAKVLDAAGSGSIANLKCAVDWIANVGGSPRADAASMSAGLGVPPLAITTLNGGELDLFGWDRQAEILPLTKDIPFAVAAGNWIGTGVEFLGLSESVPAGVNGVNQVSSPGFGSYVLTVGAVDDYQASGTFSAVGPGKSSRPFKPDVAAHGVQTWGALRATGNRYEQWSGTSMATPVAGGVLALLIEKNPSLTHFHYEGAMRNGAVQGYLWSGIAYQPDPNLVMGYGVVKAANSLALV